MTATMTTPPPPTPAAGLGSAFFPSTFNAPTPTRTIDDLVESSAGLLNHTRGLNQEVADLHGHAAELHLDRVTLKLDDDAVRRTADGVTQLLEALANRGFAWRDIARILDVSVPALRKWRMGRSPSPENLVALARIVVLVEWLETDHHVTGVAAWLEVPLIADVPISRLDILARGHRDLLIRSVMGEGLSADKVLDLYEPKWLKQTSEFEVFEAADGQRSIRRRQA